MARTLEQPETADGPALLELVDAALHARGTLTPTDACALLAPLPDALDAARASGRAVTLPRGTERDTRAVMAALGLANAPRTPKGAPVPFRAPELDPGAAPTTASDVYAVAGLLRTAVTGQDPPPWTLATMPSSREAPGLRGMFGAILWDGLADDPAQRPGSPRALLDAAAEAAERPAQREREAAAAPDSRRLSLIGAAVAGAFFLGLLLVATGDQTARQRVPERVALLPAALAPQQVAAQTKAAYADDLALTMRRLNVRRVARRSRLAAATTARGQSRTATALAEAYGIAARSAARALPPPNAAATHGAIVDAMRLTESGYRRMARGARDDDRSQYGAGRDAVRRREALLQRRVQRLAQLGYDVR